MINIYTVISKLTPIYLELANKYTNDINEANDSVQDLMEYFINMDKQTLTNIYNTDGETGLIKYGTVVIKRALTSVRSPFYYKYKKYYTHISSFYENNTGINAYRKTTSIQNIPDYIEQNPQYEKLELIDTQLEKLHWYDKKLFQLYYYENHTYDSLAKVTGISRNSLFTTIDKVRNILKDELCNE